LIIKDNCIAGVGTGDVKDELKLKYLEYNLTDAYSQDLNVHNQFLETFMGVGLLSFLVLLLMLFAPVIIALKRGDLLSASFFIIFIVLMLVESTFNSQAGVVFFVFFYCLIVTNLKARITCTT
jgi:O-antigen ligase